MCGAKDIVKQDGYFVCQACGTKYSPEEAKKLMIEGTVKIDNSEKLDNWYKLARQAKQSNDSENAAKYYDLIKQEDPNSWEAYFYNVYYRAAQTKVLFIESAANSLNNCLGTVFELIKNNEDDIDTKKRQAREVAASVTLLCDAFENSSKSSFIEGWNGSFGKYSSAANTCMKYFTTYAKRSATVYNTLFNCGNLIERHFGDDVTLNKIARDCWKAGINIWGRTYAMFDDHTTRYQNMKNTYVAKIQKYEPSFVFSAPRLYGFPTAYTNVVNKNINYDFQSSSTANASNSSSGGCYVATAVYGSYDCPEVWTLRRYRDNILAETSLGRAFIKTYYAISPTLVKWFGHTEWFKKMWKGKLDRMVRELRENGVEDTPYNDKQW